MKSQSVRTVSFAAYKIGLVAFAVAIAISLASLPALAANGIWRLDSDHSTARLFLGSTTDPESFNVAVARVDGQMNLDAYDPTNSSVEFTVYPAGAGQVGSDGKLANGEFPTTPYATVTFKSTRSVVTKQGNLEVTGNLILTQVERSVTASPTEDYSGPIYGDAVVSTTIHEVTFVFPSVGKWAGKQTASAIVSASTHVGHENFPQLQSAILSTNWPPVVEDENCQPAASIGEDYAGSSCTGSTVPVVFQAVADTHVGEAYQGFEVAPPSGSQVTIELELAAVRSARPSLSAGN